MEKKQTAPEVKIERRDRRCGISLRLRSEGADGTEQESRTIEGMAIVFGVPSEPIYADEKNIVREVISPDAIPQELLDASDILATLYHDDSRILARSKQGKGTLQYTRDDSGVRFSFEAPHTQDGDTALELVSRGIIDGCSFQYGVDISDPEAEEQTMTEGADGRREITLTVKKIAFIRDFTLTPRPAYTDTEVSARMRAQTQAVEDTVPDAVIEADLEMLRAITRD